MNNGLYEHIEMFVAIAQAKSLTAASIATGIGQATISRQLATLEEHLTCRLFERSTRAIRLTEHGEAFLPYALKLLEIMSEATATIQDDKTRLRGRIRVACSNGFGKKLLIPMLDEWYRLYPEVSIELILSDQLSQVIEERVDVAFRIGELMESSLIARQIGKFERIVVATPAYLKKQGALKSPADLDRHQCVLFSGAEPPDVWNFTGAMGELKMRVQGRLSLSTLDAMYEAVLAGLGIAIMPEWFWTHELLDGRVRRLLVDYKLSSRAISAVTATRQSLGSKTAIFIKFVEKNLGKRVNVSAP